MSPTVTVYGVSRPELPPIVIWEPPSSTTVEAVVRALDVLGRVRLTQQEIADHGLGPSPGEERRRT